jgi:hypothetical protein
MIAGVTPESIAATIARAFLKAAPEKKVRKRKKRKRP